MSTDNGDLDCLGSVDTDRRYEDLLSSTRELSLGDGSTIKVLDLAALIEVKRRAGRPKDLAVIPYLEATLDEIRRSAR